MARTESTMKELGTPLPDFALPDVDGTIHAAGDFARAPAVLVVFWCNHCPYVRHIKRAFSAFVDSWRGRGLAVVAINANDAASYPADSPEKMREDIAEFGYSFPYLIDETQSVARAFDAACTPDFFLYGPERTLVYRGQFDASRPGNSEPVTGADLEAAVEAVLSGQPVAARQVPSMGCNIKWRAG